MMTAAILIRSPPVPFGRSIAPALVACTCVATGVLISKPIVEGLPVLPVVFLQVLAALVVTWPVALVLGRAPSPRRLFALGWPGVLQPGLAYVLGFAGLAITPVSVEGLLFAFETALVVLLAWPLLGERPTRRMLIVLAIGTVGVVLVTGTATTTSAPPLLGVALILGGVAAAALDTVATRQLALHADPLTLTTATQLAGLLTIAASAPLWRVADLSGLWSPSVLAATFVSGVLIHGAAPWLINKSLQHLTAGATALLFPLISLLIAAGGVICSARRCQYFNWSAARSS